MSGCSSELEDKRAGISSEVGSLTLEELAKTGDDLEWLGTSMGKSSELEETKGGMSSSKDC